MKIYLTSWDADGDGRRKTEDGRQSFNGHSMVIQWSSDFGLLASDFGLINKYLK
jgi:hypothetical protein